MSKVESHMEKSSGFKIDEEVVVMSSDGTIGKLPSTIADQCKQRPQSRRAPRF